MIAARSDIIEGSQFYSPNSEKVKNIITAYGNLDAELGYNQGYNFIVTLLLRFVPDEENAFWCLVHIMNGLNWRECFLEGMPLMARL